MRERLALFLFIFLAVCMVQTAGLPSAEAAGPPVTMTVTDADVRDVLSGLAAIGKVNIVIDDSVKGNVSVNFKNMPFETALDVITRTKGLISYHNGRVLIVTTPEKMTKGFGRAEIIKLEYGNAEELKKSLGSIVPDERIKFDASTNSLIVFGSPTELEQIRTALKDLDIPYLQIMLEAQVVALSTNAIKNLGISWNWADFPQVPVDSTTTTSTSTTVTQKTRTLPGVIQFGGWKNPEGTPFEFQFSAKLSALMSNGEGKILARPNIMTINGKEATILIGDKIPVVTEKTENGKTTAVTEYLDAGIKLTYTPRINSADQISAVVKTEVSTPTLVPEMKAYKITTRSASTNVRLRDGETMVIGGLISSEESGGKNRIPYLSNLPILGKLFESVSKTKTETEVVIFLKAKIIK